MDWITNAHNRKNADLARQEDIKKLAPTLWKNITHAIEQAVQMYAALDDFPVEFSGRADHTIWVATFETRMPRQRGPERERVTINFDQNANAIEVRSSLKDEPKVYPVGLNRLGHACLMDDSHEISIEEFTERVLNNAFFPPEPRRS